MVVVYRLTIVFALQIGQVPLVSCLFAMVSIRQIQWCVHLMVPVFRAIYVRVMQVLLDWNASCQRASLEIVLILSFALLMVVALHQTIALASMDILI